MTKQYSQLALLFFLSTLVGFAQEKREIDNSKTRVTSDIYQYRQEITNYLQISQLEGFGNQSNRLNNQNSGNSVLIQQVGVNNTASSQTNSSFSDIQYLQVGLRNSIESINTIENASESVIQFGIDNSLINNSFGTINTSRLDVIQTGNNLNMEKYGSNARTNNMALRMTGQNRTVIIRSN